MREAWEQISPATWHCYAHARSARSAGGGWPSAEALIEVARGEGADPWALLVLTRGELPGLTPDRPREPTGTIEGISLSFNQRWRVNYRPNGRAKSGTFTVCDDRGEGSARAVILFWSGRPRVAPRAASGDPLHCGHT